MIKVYELNFDLDKVTAFALVDTTMRGFYNQFDGRPLAASWLAPAVAPADTLEADARLGDCTVLGTVPLISARAVESLHELMADRCELLPVSYSRRELYILNVTEIVDCLNEEVSRIQRFETGRVMRIDRYSFIEDSISKAAIFRIPQLLRGHLYVTDRFVKRAREAKLVGFRFELLWSSQ